MKQIVLLNRDQLIQLAGLSAGSDSQYVIIIQEAPDDPTAPVPLLMPPILVKREVSGQMQEFVMTATGLHQQRS